MKQSLVASLVVVTAACGPAGSVSTGEPVEAPPLVNLYGPHENGVALRTLRRSEQGWTLIHEVRLARELGPSVSRVVGEELFVGWTESAQIIDTGFEHYTDCSMHLERVRL